MTPLTDSQWRLSLLRLAALSVRQRVVGRAMLHLYCVGTPKSGTHSLAAIFGKHYRSQHEPGHRELIDALPDVTSAGADSAITRLLKIRRLAFDLDLESSHVLAPFAPKLAGIFPSAKFVLPVREPMGWLESMLDELHFAMQLDINQHWWQAYDCYFGSRGGVLPAEERCLQDRGLYSVDQLLAYWLRHHKRLLTGVPPERLLVLPTHRIQDSSQLLADFAGIAAETLDMTQGRSYVRRERSGLIDELGREYVQNKLEAFKAQALVNGIAPELLEGSGR